MTWRLAQSLETLRAEVNAAAPNRMTVADGSIGDEAHSSRLSDHNPNDAGVVRAVDITHDPSGGCDAGELAEHIRQLGLDGHPALGSGAYVIWNWRIASATEDGQPWDWEPYTGSNGHTHHVHVSVATAAAGYDSTAPWGWEEDMALTTAQAADLKAAAENTKALLSLARAERDDDKRRQTEIRNRLRALKKQGNATARDIDELLALAADEEA